MGVQLQVSGLNFLKLDTYVIYMSIKRALMDFLQCFTQFSTFMKSATVLHVFTQKNFTKNIFNSKICCDLLVIGPRVVKLRE